MEQKKQPLQYLLEFLNEASPDTDWEALKRSAGKDASAKDIKDGEWRLQVDAANFITVRQPLTIASKNPPLNVTLKRDNSPELLTKAEAIARAAARAASRRRDVHHPPCPILAGGGGETRKIG